MGQTGCLLISKPQEKRGLQLCTCKPAVLKPSMWMQAVMDADASDQGKSTAAHHTAAGMPNATAEVRYDSAKDLQYHWRLSCLELKTHVSPRHTGSI